MEWRYKLCAAPCKKIFSSMVNEDAQNETIYCSINYVEFFSHKRPFL